MLEAGPNVIRRVRLLTLVAAVAAVLGLASAQIEDEAVAQLARAIERT